MVLSNIGALLFSKPGSYKPEYFLPFSNTQIILRQPKGVDKKYCIKIKYENNDKEFVLSLRSEPELNEWYDLLTQLQMECFKVASKQLQSQKTELQGKTVKKDSF